MTFYRELVAIEQQLMKHGFIVNIPISAQTMKKNNDFEVSHFKGVFSYEERGKMIHSNFEKIATSDSILVVNNEKNGIQGYIGANVLMEIAIAYYFKKKIFVWNPIEEKALYKEELLAFGAEFINKELTKIW